MLAQNLYIVLFFTSGAAAAARLEMQAGASVCRELLAAATVVWSFWLLPLFVGSGRAHVLLHDSCVHCCGHNLQTCLTYDMDDDEDTSHVCAPLIKLKFIMIGTKCFSYNSSCRQQFYNTMI